MKRLFYLATVTLTLVHLMTAIIGWPAGDAYSLVIKPYPSLLKQIPHMEMRSWEAAVASGEVPKWVAQRQYIELASGGDEIEPPPLVRIYIFSQMLTVAALAFAALLLAVRLFKRWRVRSANLVGRDPARGLRSKHSAFRRM